MKLDLTEDEPPWCIRNWTTSSRKAATSLEAKTASRIFCPAMLAALFNLATALPAGSFAFVMATGIVSLAAEMQSFYRVAAALFIINLTAFPVLWMLALVCLAREPAVVIRELGDHQTGPGFLTIVAGTAIIGDQFAVLSSAPVFAASLWVTAGALWLLLVYGFLIGVTTRPNKPPLAAGLDGSWLLVVVASEALAILGSHVSTAFAQPEIVIFLGLCWFLLGGFFYFLVISLIVYRWLFESMPALQLTPTYWINMGPQR